MKCVIITLLACLAIGCASTNGVRSDNFPPAIAAQCEQATGLTGDQVRDGIFLKELFAELSAWNGGETWTLFEGPLAEVIP